LLPERATAVAFVAYTPSGDREFVFHIRHAAAGALSPDQVQSDYFTSVRCLHISGSTLALSAECRAACQRAVDLTRAAGGFVSFDPNLRPELMTVDAFRPIALDFCRQADLILPTASELIAITGQPDEDSALQHLLAETDALIAVKRGALGCTLVNRRERIDQPGFRVEEVDPTGAGDCFNAACVLGLLEGWPLAETARFAAAAGALAVTRQGPMEGAHDRAAVERFSHASG
jgi:sugar/nucleoside kinase (ribokinase family)